MKKTKKKTSNRSFYIELSLSHRNRPFVLRTISICYSSYYKYFAQVYRICDAGDSSGGEYEEKLSAFEVSTYLPNIGMFSPVKTAIKLSRESFCSQWTIFDFAYNYFCWIQRWSAIFMNDVGRGHWVKKKSSNTILLDNHLQPIRKGKHLLPSSSNPQRNKIIILCHRSPLSPIDPSTHTRSYQSHLCVKKKKKKKSSFPGRSMMIYRKHTFIWLPALGKVPLFK